MAQPKSTTRANKAKPKNRTASKPAPRTDFGAPIDGFFEKQPADLRHHLGELRKMIEQAAPDATSSLKWGMPTFSLNGKIMCVLAGHKAHINLVLSGSPEAYADPDGVLEGTGKTGRHLKITAKDELPRGQIQKWLKTAAKLARS